MEHNHHTDLIEADNLSVFYIEGRKHMLRRQEKDDNKKVTKWIPSTRWIETEDEVKVVTQQWARLKWLETDRGDQKASDRATTDVLFKPSFRSGFIVSGNVK